LSGYLIPADLNSDVDWGVIYDNVGGLGKVAFDPITKVLNTSLLNATVVNTTFIYKTYSTIATAVDNGAAKLLALNAVPAVVKNSTAYIVACTKLYNATMITTNDIS